MKRRKTHDREMRLPLGGIDAQRSVERWNRFNAECERRRPARRGRKAGAK